MVFVNVYYHILALEEPVKLCTQACPHLCMVDESGRMHTELCLEQAGSPELSSAQVN